MNWLIIKIIIFIFLLPFSTANSEIIGCDNNNLECSPVFSSLVYNSDNGRIISETRSENNIYPASLVKLMTVYLVFEAIESGTLSLDDVVAFSKRGEEISKINKITTLNVLEGDLIKIKDAIRGTIIKSFNEAAIVLAEAVSGNEWSFVRLMNEKAKDLGMINTSFRNATGLHAEGQYTTAYDLARLARSLKNDFWQYYHYFSEEEFSFNGKNFITHNHVLREYPGAKGLKTGFTRASGFNLISAAWKNDNKIVSILANCSSFEDRDQQTKDIFNQSFSKLNDVKKPTLGSKITEGFSYEKLNPKAIYYESINMKHRIGGGAINAKSHL